MATGGHAAVAGVAQLLPGSYGFHCSLHSFMTGRLAVTGLRVGVPAQSLSAARRAVRVRVALWPQGAATISATLAGRSLPAVQRTLAGATIVRIAVPAKVHRALRTASRARLVVSVGAAGASVRATRTLR